MRRLGCFNWVLTSWNSRSDMAPSCCKRCAFFHSRSNRSISICDRSSVALALVLIIFASGSPLRTTSPSRTKILCTTPVVSGMMLTCWMLSNAPVISIVSETVPVSTTSALTRTAGMDGFHSPCPLPFSYSDSSGMRIALQLVSTTLLLHVSICVEQSNRLEFKGTKP